MDGEDDDFYASGEGGPQAMRESTTPEDEPDTKQEKMEDELEEGEEEESDDSDVEFVLEAKDNAEPAPPQNRYNAIKQEQPRPSSTDQSTRIQQQSTASRISTAPAAPAPQRLQDGSKFPEVHTSTVDVNADPVYEPAGKPITQVDIDADMAEHTKPWRLPGSDQSDYFNYGFDEFTWTSYLIRQKSMSANLESQKAETAQFQQMFGAGMPGMSGAPSAPSGGQNGGGGAGAGGAGGMPGMPSEQEVMQMAQYMMASGQDPSQMDFNTFMNAFGTQGGGQSGGQGNFGNYNQNQGSGQNAQGGGQGGGGGGNYGGGRGGRRGRW